MKFEQGNEEQISKSRPPNIYDNMTNLIYLDHNDPMIDVRSKVPHPGYYVFVVHYFQPNYPGEFMPDKFLFLRTKNPNYLLKRLNVIKKYNLL